MNSSENQPTSSPLSVTALLGAEWMPFESAPKDGTTFRLRQGNLAFTHGFYRGGQLIHIEYRHTNRPTHWAPAPNKADSTTCSL